MIISEEVGKIHFNQTLLWYNFPLPTLCSSEYVDALPPGTPERCTQTCAMIKRGPAPLVPCSISHLSLALVCK